MNETVSEEPANVRLDSGLVAIAGVAAYYRTPADPIALARELALGERTATSEDLVRAARILGLRARLHQGVDVDCLKDLPAPVIARRLSGDWIILEGRMRSGLVRVVDPISREDIEREAVDILAEIEPQLVLIQRRFELFNLQIDQLNLRWFGATVWRYRRPLANVLLASFLCRFSLWFRP